MDQVIITSNRRYRAISVGTVVIGSEEVVRQTGWGAARSERAKAAHP